MGYWHRQCMSSCTMQAATSRDFLSDKAIGHACTCKLGIKKKTELHNVYLSMQPWRHGQTWHACTRAVTSIGYTHEADPLNLDVWHAITRNIHLLLASAGGKLHSLNHLKASLVSRDRRTRILSSDVAIQFHCATIPWYCVATVGSKSNKQDRDLLL